MIGDVPNMSDLSPPDRSLSGRKGSRKVRTGCITCKVRKVKCDEAKPFCVRCLKSGRKCDGYLDPSIMASRRKAHKERGGLSPYSAFSALLEWALPEEKRSLHFFQQVTAPHLAGDLDAIFWKVLVLQVCQTEPAVRHAVLAVSSFHECLTLGAQAKLQSSPLNSSQLGRPGLPLAGSSGATAQDAGSTSPGSNHSFALQQYNKAISCLLSQMRDPTVKPLAPLLTCVLFVCLEFMHGKDKESLIHLEQGRQILSKLGRRASSKDPEIDIIKRHLVPIYLRLSVTSFLIGAEPAPVPQALKTMQDVPAMFDTVQEIRFALYDFIDESLRFTHRARQARLGDDVPQETFVELAAEREDLQKRLAKFNIAFSLYQATKSTHMSECSSAVFQMYLHLLKIWIATALSNEEAVFDDHLPSFSAIIPLAATILNSETSNMNREFRSARNSQVPGVHHPPPNPHQNGARTTDQERQTQSIFTFETYVIPALYYVATKCRHPLIRHSALDLLKQNPQRRENLWRAKRMAAIAEHIIKVEEDSAMRSPSSLGNGFLPDPSLLAFPELLPSIEPPAIASDFMRPKVSISTDGEYYPRNISLDHPEQMHPQHHMDLDPLDMENSALLSLDDLDIDIPIDPTLMMEVSAAMSRAASYASHDDRLVSTVSSADMGGAHSLLAPSPLPHLTMSATPSRASSVASISPGTTYANGDWHEAHSGSDHSSSPTSEHNVVMVSTTGGIEPTIIAETSPPIGLGIQQHPHHPHQYHHNSQYQQQQRYQNQQHQHQPLHGGGQYRTTQHAAPVTAPHKPFRPQLQQCNTEAPFDIPENIRVHDVLIGPEKDDGSWLTVFRKLHGPTADWNVHTEYIMA